MGDTLKVHLLDVGTARYGDSVLCQAGGTTILVDGGHRGDDVPADGFQPIHQQIADLLDTAPPVAIDLLVISHAHDDHIGCLPELIANGSLTVRWAYLPHPNVAWPAEAGEALLAAGPVLEALREEDLSDLSDDDLANAITSAGELRARYSAMLAALSSNGTTVVYHGADTTDLETEFAAANVSVLGPSLAQLYCARGRMTQVRKFVESVIAQPGGLALPETGLTGVTLYRTLYQTLASQGFGANGEPSRAGAAVNAQSAVVTVGPPGSRVLLAGDMQFSSPGGPPALNTYVADLWSTVIGGGPYQFAKLSHHGSENANPAGFPAELECGAFGVCTGSDGAGHPSPVVLTSMADAEVNWARTDTNGRSTITIESSGEVTIVVATGAINDSTDP